MKDFMPILKNCTLLDTFNEKEITSVLHCIHASLYKIKKNEDVFQSQEIKMGIVLSGQLKLSQIDFKGNQNIITTFLPSDIFGESFVCANILDYPINITAQEDSEIMFINYSKIISVCHNSCTFHNKLIQNMLKIIAEKNVLLNKKLQHLTKRTTKEKVMSYLNEQSLLLKNSSFEIPFNRQELADYLSIDRSALSFELSKLKKEGLINYHKNKFYLL